MNAFFPPRHDAWFFSFFMKCEKLFFVRRKNAWQHRRMNRRENSQAFKEKKRILRGIFHTFYVQLMFDVLECGSCLCFLSLVGHGRRMNVNVGHLLITKYDHFFLSWLCFFSLLSPAGCVQSRRHVLLDSSLLLV